MHTLAGVPNVAVIRFSEDDKLLWLLSRIASFLDLPVSEEQLQEALDAHRDPLDPNQTVLRACRVVYDSSEKMRTYARNYTIEERDIIQTLGKSYEPLLIDPYIDTIHWPIEALVNAETGSPLSSPIELLGPARIISYGPYLYVPRGRWLITLTFDVRDNHSGARLMIDIYTPGLDRVLVAAKGEIPLSGAFSTSMDFEIDSSLHAIEIRLYSQVGAIEGVIEVLDISLQKQAEI
ncbi:MULTISPECIES: hypothetical protein [unclassified Ensifer]|uniref:hypothetical protein n=1 Tax=unclassified Ensifer TaxID=2633371 RepID=UPI000714D00E|nr:MULTISPECIES: hypothetical protein [unclassified Ensifer]KQX44810.1 hypothetical protein ASD49_07000 [Ensifer sp. Root1298]KQX76652.1 hypothetical protein ASD41_07250 [Ensifer sp. Root1312]KRC17164.1 hypothetical protein ASE29_07895 [Ensifer sp. Root74]KRD62194.1 hypothetical protein ASE71_07970 [Ensifer sp. Root954]